ncbi:TPA: RcnB family protein [Klebsiella michiganensis]
MKKILSLAIILSCALTSVSWADGPGGNNRGQQQVWQQDAGRGGPDGNRQQGPGKGPQGNPHQERHERDHFAWNGHDFRKGQPAPERYRGNDYRINDWNDRGLPAPPHGQHWSYIDGNYVLIAAATGIITSILINGALSH